jgi:hypothetical protein
LKEDVEGRRLYMKEGRKDGRTEGRKEGRTDGRKEGRYLLEQKFEGALRYITALAAAVLQGRKEGR